MSNALTARANSDYGFGYSFNYGLWIAGTHISLTNVPWNNDYRDVVNFPDASSQTLDEYIDANEVANIEFPNVNYIKISNNRVRLNCSFNNALRFNYLRVQNPAQPVVGDFAKAFYYFILDVVEIAPNTTEFTLQLDVFQSFAGEYSFGQCYVERGHIGIANENAFSNYGRDFLTVPEGIDYGGEYRIIERASNPIIENSSGVMDGTILVVSTIDLTANPGTVENPILTTASGSTFEGLVSGASFYVFQNEDTFKNWLAGAADTPWVTQGIVSITLMPNLTRYMPTFWNNFTHAEIVSGNPLDASAYLPASVVRSMYVNWRNAANILSAIPSRYSILKKFFTFPYMVIELTTWTGTPIILKPESWTDPDATIVERATLTPPNQRVEFYPRRYNALPGSEIEIQDSDFTDVATGDDGGDYLDLATKIANFPTLAILNNGALGYLASNFANIAYQRQSAEWTETRALRGNDVTYDQNKRGITTTRNVNALTRAGTGAGAASANEQLAQSAAANGLGGDIISIAQAATGAAGGNIGLSGPVGAVGSQIMQGINAGIQSDTNTRNANIANQVNSGQTAGITNQSAYVNDTNKGLADWSAKGDYENTIAGVNAMVRGASMTPPTTSGQQGGETINLVNGTFEVRLRWKLIDNASLKLIGDYWLRYGYAVRQFIQFPGFMVMSKFTYWKLQETYINSSSMPEGFKQIIRGIFEKGVTVWSDPTYIGNTDLADNTPLTGVTL